MMNEFEKSFKITILGSGTCVPCLTRSACSVLMEIGEATLVFDTGPGTMRRLLRVGMQPDDIDFLFYSHFHPDHTSELVPFLFATKYPYGNRRKTPLNIVAGNGFADFFDKLRQVYGQWIELEPDRFNIIELDTQDRDSMTFEEFQVDSIPVSHRPESIAFKISNPMGVSAVYSGDTDYSENLVRLSKNSDILICESALPDQLKVDGHMTPSLAGRTADLANVRHLVLTHFYPECDNIDIAGQCRKTYAGRLTLAQDLMTIKPAGNMEEKSNLE